MKFRGAIFDTEGYELWAPNLERKGLAGSIDLHYYFLPAFQLDRLPSALTVGAEVTWSRESREWNERFRHQAQGWSAHPLSAPFQSWLYLGSISAQLESRTSHLVTDTTDPTTRDKTQKRACRKI